MSQVEAGDLLVATFSDGRTIHLLPVRHGCNRRWIYAQSTWLPGDRALIEELCQKYKASAQAADGPGNLTSGSVDVYLPLRFRLDSRLQCQVEVRWQNDAKGRERYRDIGHFFSTGDIVTSVAASTL